MLIELHEEIWQVNTQKDGPTITVIGGTHGNEQTGIEVVKRMHAQLTSGDLRLAKGVLNLILGNPKAIDLNKRGSVPHQDLNRSFHLDLLQREPDGTYEDARARLIAPLLEESDIVIDLHATNKPSEPFLACLHSVRHAKAYKWFPCTKVLTDPNFVLGGTPVTTDEYTEAHGGIGICYETGLAWDTSWAEDVLEHVKNLLKDQGLIEGAVVEGRTCEQEIYEIVEPIILTDKGFQYEPPFGERSWDTFAAGAKLGVHGTNELIVAFDGVVVFPKAAEHWREGKPVGYLAKRVQE